MAVSLKNVAAMAGVAPITVSRVLNNSPLVTDNTRAKVMAVCRSSGYQPHAGARALRSNKFNTIGLLLPAEEGHMLLPYSLLSGIADELEKHKIALQIMRLTNHQMTSSDFIPRILSERMVDGLLINYAIKIPPKLIEHIEEHHLPSVWINIKKPFNCVYPDIFNGAAKAIEYLISLGHKHIAYLDFSNGISTHHQTHYSAKDAYDGACATANEHHQEINMEIINSDNVSRRERLNFMQDKLSRLDRPSAIFTVSYRHALICLYAALAAGLKVPEDLSIITFYDKPVYDDIGIAFDTVSIPETKLGSVAVNMLLKKINQHEDRMSSICIDMPFTAGDTCGYQRKIG